MPTSTDKAQRPRRDRDRQPPTSRKDEPRDFETQVSDFDRDYDAPFDGNLEPIERDTGDEEDINTHGSDR